MSILQLPYLPHDEYEYDESKYYEDGSDNRDLHEEITFVVHAFVVFADEVKLVTAFGNAVKVCSAVGQEGTILKILLKYNHIFHFLIYLHHER